MKDEKFTELYRKLNLAQKRAVDAIEGPVMVIAGPGTGKTQILTLRIANILRRTDTSPKSILALTFTESGAYSMRKRLVEIVGSDAYKIHIYTFHGFCNEIIQRYPEEFPLILGSSHVNESEQIRIIENIIKKGSYKKIKSYGDPFFHVRGILDGIRSLKRENISPEEFKALIAKQIKDFKNIPDLYHEKGAFAGEMKGKYKDLEKAQEKNKELADAYRKYQKALREKKWIDFEDMIIEVIKELEKNRDLLLRLGEEYQYVLADEHQDANNAQNRLLELLSSFHKNPNLFIVGDEKQAIFRFQGASLENFLYFKKVYPEALVVNLEENYRSPQHILDSAHSLISHSPVSDKSLRVPLISSQKGVPGKILLYQFSKPEYEYAFLATDIEEKIKRGINPGSIAILYRDNKDVFPIVQVFEKTKIPYSIESGQDVLSDPDIEKLILILKTIHNYGDDALLASMLHIDFLDIPPIDIYKLLKYSKEKKVSLYASIKDKTSLAGADVEAPKEISALYLNLTKWAKESHNLPLVEFFEIVVRESGFLDSILSGKAAIDKMNKLDNLFDEVKKIIEINREAKLKDLIYYLEVIRSYNVLLKIKEPGEMKANVHLMTAHKAKGQEYDYVYIAGVYDKHWGNKREMASFKLPFKGVDPLKTDPNEDERRLFYVALTRAKKQIALTYSETSPNKEKQLPSQFISEIDQALVEVVPASDIEKNLSKNSFAYKREQKESLNLKNQGYLRNLFLDQGLSVTAINNYIECPWKYFFRNLVRVPEAQDKSALYGTAIHITLCHFFEKYKAHEDLSRKQLIILFEKFLRKLPLSDSDFKEAKIKGKRALLGYYDTYKKSWPRNILTEYKIAGVFINTPINGESINVLLKGNLDKIEFIDGKHVRVVDYKTSKPKSRNEIEGKTKNSEGNLKRQLVFYKLLLEKHSDLNWCMKEGMLDFVEPDEKGKYKREVFSIENTEIDELEKEIKRIAKEVYNFEFWNTACDDKKCEYCRLRQMMKNS